MVLIVIKRIFFFFFNLKTLIKDEKDAEFDILITLKINHTKYYVLFNKNSFSILALEINIFFLYVMMKAR